jgi:hypothetical protein
MNLAEVHPVSETFDEYFLARGYSLSYLANLVMVFLAYRLRSPDAAT